MRAIRNKSLYSVIAVLVSGYKESILLRASNSESAKEIVERGLKQDGYNVREIESITRVTTAGAVTLINIGVRSWVTL